MDEPTSGMDNLTRGVFWDIINKYKWDRYIILTTHYMDEVEELADCICVLKDGKVDYFGSPQALRMKNSSRIYLNLWIKPEKLKTAAQSFVLSKLANSKIEESTSDQAKFSFSNASSDDLKHFFSVLDSCLDSIDVTTYTISTCSLGEIIFGVTSKQSQGTDCATLGKVVKT